MPGFDGTGPLGTGPMTGGGMGFCVERVADAGGSSFGQDHAGQRSEPVGAFAEAAKEVMTMPAGDGTGPFGLGPMTGRAAGYCAGYPVPGYGNPISWQSRWLQRSYPGVSYPLFPQAYGYGTPWLGARLGGPGRGWGRGFGRGRGRGRRFWGW